MVSLVVQAGGQSSRMGTNKAVMPFLGQVLISRVISRLQSIAAEVLITTNQPEAFAFLGFPLIQDVFPNSGPLGGLYTALDKARYPLVAVVACDMPFVSSELIEIECKLLTEKNVDAVIPRTADGYEPFHAVYRKKSCLEAIGNVLMRGERRVVSWFADVDIYILEGKELQVCIPHEQVFMNLNTREEFALAEDLARREAG
jgi:molybdenum cofactor guanylyltransferase